jgi:hypothetical protein
VSTKVKKKLFKFISLLLCFCFFIQQTGLAQVSGQLDISGHFAQLRNQIVREKYRPLHLRYLSYDNQNNNFNLLLDKGDARNLKKAVLEDTTKTLLNYFFVGISLPNDSFWVNLRPDAEDNIIDPLLAKTDLGKVLLEADLQLKKDTAQCTSPETPEGKEYWDKLYKKAGELLGADNITIPTLTRPWIVPNEIIIRETDDNAYIYKATLKVMLEQDYLKGSAVYNFEDDRLKALNEYASELIREKILPKITKDVNTAKRYAPLRQVYYSLIMAQWFKARFYGKGGVYSWMIDKKNLNGLTSQAPWSKSTYFKEYQRSFKDGEYNLKIPVSTPMGQSIRSYFSGGMNLTDFQVPAPGVSSPVVSSIVGHSRAGSSPLARFNNDILFSVEGGTPGDPTPHIELKSDVPEVKQEEPGQEAPPPIPGTPAGQTSHSQSASPLSKITKSILALAVTGFIFSQGIIPLGQKVLDSFLKPSVRQENVVKRPVPKLPAAQPQVKNNIIKQKIPNLNPKPEDTAALERRKEQVATTIQKEFPSWVHNYCERAAGYLNQVTRYKFSPAFIKTLLALENPGLDPFSVSYKVAIGLPQINSETFETIIDRATATRRQIIEKNGAASAEQKQRYAIFQPFSRNTGLKEDKAPDGKYYKLYEGFQKRLEAASKKKPGRPIILANDPRFQAMVRQLFGKNALDRALPPIIRAEQHGKKSDLAFVLTLMSLRDKQIELFVPIISNIIRELENNLGENVLSAMPEHILALHVASAYNGGPRRAMSVVTGEKGFSELPLETRIYASVASSIPGIVGQSYKPKEPSQNAALQQKTGVAPVKVAPAERPGARSIPPAVKVKKSSSPLEKSEASFPERFGQGVLNALRGYFIVSDFETRLYELIGVKAFMKWLPEYKAQLETRRQEYDSTNLNFNTEAFAEFVKKLPDEYQKIYIVHGPEALIRQLPEEYRAAREQFKRQLTVEERKARLEQDLKRVDDRVTKTKAHEVKKLLSFLVFLSPVIAAPFAAVPVTLMSVVILASLSLGNAVFNLYPLLVQRYNRNRAEKNSIWITRELSRLNTQTSSSPMSRSSGSWGPIVESRMASPAGTWGMGVVLSAAEQRKVALEVEKVTQYLVQYKPDIINDILAKLNFNFTFADISKLSIGYLASGANKHAFKVEIVNKDGEHKAFSVALKLPVQNEEMFEEGEEDVLNDLWGTGFVPNLGKVLYLRATSSDPAGYEYSETKFDSGEYLTVLIEEFVDGFTLGQVDTLCGLIANNKELSNIVQGMLSEGRITIGDAKEQVRSALMKIRPVQLMAAKDAALPDALVELLDALLKWDKDYKILSEIEPHKNIITETLAKSVSEFLAMYFFVLNKQITLDGRMSLDLHSNNIMLEKATGALRIIDPGKTIQGSLDEFIIEMLFYYGVSPSNVEKILPRLMALLSVEQQKKLQERLDQYQDPRLTNNTVEKLMEEKGSFKKRAKNIADGIRYYFRAESAQAALRENQGSSSVESSRSAGSPIEMPQFERTLNVIKGFHQELQEQVRQTTAEFKKQGREIPREAYQFAVFILGSGSRNELVAGSDLDYWIVPLRKAPLVDNFIRALDNRILNSKVIINDTKMKFSSYAQTLNYVAAENLEGQLFIRNDIKTFVALLDARPIIGDKDTAMAVRDIFNKVVEDKKQALIEYFDKEIGKLHFSAGVSKEMQRMVQYLAWSLRLRFGIREKNIIKIFEAAAQFDFLAKAQVEIGQVVRLYNDLFNLREMKEFGSAMRMAQLNKDFTPHVLDGIKAIKTIYGLVKQNQGAAGSPVLGGQADLQYESLMEKARELAKGKNLLYKEPSRKDVGWKLHLNVDDTPALAQEISAFLTKAGILHKVGKSSGQEGKGMTIYVGPRDAAEDVARRIDRYFGDRLPAAGGDVLVDDTPFSNDAGSISKIWGRFDEAQSSDFHQYGSKGLPYLKVDVNNWIFDARRNEPGRKEQYDREASQRAHERLLKDYGAFYTGTRNLSAEIIFALTPWYLQPEKPVVSPAVVPAGSPLQNKAEEESRSELALSKLVVVNGSPSFSNKQQETPQIVIPGFGQGYDGADLQFILFGNLFYEASRVSSVPKNDESLKAKGFRLVDNLAIRPTYIVVNNEREALAVQMLLDLAIKKSNGFVASLVSALALEKDNPYNIINLENKTKFTVLSEDGRDVEVEVVKDGENYKFIERYGNEVKEQEIVSRKRDTNKDEHVHKTGNFTPEQLDRYHNRPAGTVSVTFMGVNDALSEEDVTNFLINIGTESIFVDPSLEAYVNLKAEKLLPSRWILTHNHTDHNAGFVQFIIEKFSESKIEAAKEGQGQNIQYIVRKANEKINTYDLIMTQEVKDDLIEVIAAYLLGGEAFGNRPLEEAQSLSRQWARALLQNEKIERSFERNGKDEIEFIDKGLGVTIVFRNHQSHPIATYGFVVTSFKGNLGYVVDTSSMDDFTWAADKLKTQDPNGENSILISENGFPAGFHLTVGQLQKAVEGSDFLKVIGEQGNLLLVHSKDSGAVEIGDGDQKKVSEWLRRAGRFETRSAGSPLAGDNLASSSGRGKEKPQKYYPQLEALMADIRSAASVEGLLQAKIRFDGLKNDIKNNEGDAYADVIQSLELRYLVHQDMFNDAIKEKIVNGFIEQSYMKKRFALADSEIRVYKWLKSLLAIYDLRYDTQSKQLRDLNQVYDVAIGIAAAGAFSAALFDLMGLPTTLADVHVNGDTQMSRADFAWRKDSRTGKPINPEELRGKKVIICENDINTGATLEKFLNELSAYEPGQVDIVFDLRGGTFFINKENITKLQEKYAFFKNVHFMRLDTEITLSMLSEVIGLVADALKQVESLGPGTAAAGSPIISGYASRILRRPVLKEKEEIAALEKIIEENGYQAIGGVKDLMAYRLLRSLTGKGVIAWDKAVYSPVFDYGLSLYSAEFIKKHLEDVVKQLQLQGRDELRILVLGAGTGVDALTAYSQAKKSGLRIHLDALDILAEAVKNTKFNFDLAFPGSNDSEVFVHNVEKEREFETISGEYDFIYFNSPNAVYDSQVKMEGAYQIGLTDYTRLLNGIKEHLSDIGIAIVGNTLESRKFVPPGLRAVELAVHSWDKASARRTMFKMTKSASSPMSNTGNTEYLEGVTPEEEAVVKAKIQDMLSFTRGQLDSSDRIARSSARSFATVFSGDNLLRSGQLILEEAQNFLKELGITDPGEMRLYMTGGRLKNNGFKGVYDSSFSDIDIAVYVEHHQAVAQIIDNYDYSVAPFKLLNSFSLIISKACNRLSEELRARGELREDEIFPAVFEFLHNEWGDFANLKLVEPYMIIGRLNANPDNGAPPILVLSKNQSAGSPLSNIPSLGSLMEEFKEFHSLYHSVEKNGVPGRLGLFEDTQASLSGHQEWLIRWVYGSQEVNLRKADTDENMVKLYQQFLAVALSQGAESVGTIMQEAGGEQRQEGQIKSVAEQLKLTPDIVPPDQAQIIGQKPGMANLITCMAVAGYNTRTGDVALAHLAPMAEKTQTYIKRVLGPFMNSGDWNAFIIYPANEIAGVLNVADIEKYLNSAGVKVVEKIPYSENAVDVIVDSQGQAEVRNILNKELVGSFELKKSGSSIQPISSSPLKKGGIDMRALPIVTQSMNNPGMGVMPPLSRLENVNLDEEWQQIQSMIQAGIIPASDRIKEYLQACCFKDDINPQVEKVLACIADILRLEEEQLKPTEAALRDFLALLESDKPAGDLQVALSSIAFTAKEPVTIEQ